MQVHHALASLTQPAVSATTPASGSSGASGTGGTGSTSNGSSSSTASSSTDQLTNEDTFLQLLVAQIQNQDPLNPADSIQFIGQLVQFSQLEQLLSINKGVTSLAGDVSGGSGSQGAGGTSGTGGASGTGGTGGTSSTAPQNIHGRQINLK
jgi:flagellar basal-body rod modification protein FlgD